MKRQLFTLAGSCGNAQNTTTIIGYAKGLLAYDWFTIDAALVGATGSTCDVVLQRRVATADEVSGGVWVEWLRFTQLADGAAAVKYCCISGASVSIATVGHTTDASAGTTPVLAAGTFVGGHPGEQVRMVTRTGAGTSAGATQTVYIQGWRSGGREG